MNPPPQKTSALLLFSGGQDSTVCLAWALRKYERVETIGFDYNQRHKIELDARRSVLDRIDRIDAEFKHRLGDDHIIALPELGQISETALTREAEIKMTDAGLPSTFVPGRNLLFLTYAAALAYRRNINVLVGGMCETDYSGYPDCRNETMKALETAISHGMDRKYRIETPLMNITKAATWSLADVLGGQRLIDLIIEETHTCYIGDRKQKNGWGYGCGDCPACQLRAKGWQEWQTSKKN